MLYRTVRKIYILNRVGGGEIGEVIGTVRNIMTVGGVLIPGILTGKET
jgi:hypothetical protein